MRTRLPASGPVGATGRRRAASSAASRRRVLASAVAVVIRTRLDTSQAKPRRLSTGRLRGRWRPAAPHRGRSPSAGRADPIGNAEALEDRVTACPASPSFASPPAPPPPSVLAQIGGLNEEAGPPKEY